MQACRKDTFYREDGDKKRRSLRTRNELIANKELFKYLEDRDRGLLGFSLRPKALPFDQAAREYLEEGTHDLAEASMLRHRQNVFGLCKKKLEDGTVAYIEGKGHLLRFFRDRNLKSMRTSDVLSYRRFREKQKASPNTILKELATLSAIFGYYMGKDVLLSNPVLAAKKPKIKLVRPNRKLTENELQRIYCALYPGARRVFIAFCETGARLREIRNCNVSDVDFDSLTLRVVGKGSKERLIPINEVLLQAIRDEIAGRPNASPSDALFLNREGHRFFSLRTPLARACRLAGVKHCSHHSLRHSYATLMHKSGRDMVIISKILGHANPTVTQNIYVDPLPEDVRQAGMNFRIDVTGMGQKRGK